LHNYFGDGYGCETTAGRLALKTMLDWNNIKLEPTYTAKTFAAVLDYLKENLPTKDPVLYWHTYNSADLSERARCVDYRDLPGEFHRFFIKVD